MLGLMQDWPLLCHRVIDHAATYHPARPVVSRSLEGPLHTTNYAEIRARALKVAQRLERERVPVAHSNCAATKPCSALAMSGSSVSARVIVMSQLSRGDTPSRISTPA